MIEDVSAVQKLKYVDAGIKAITQLPIEAIIDGKFTFKFRHPKHLVVNSYSEIKNQVKAWVNSLPAVPTNKGIFKLKNQDRISIENLLKLSKKSIINKNILGWYDHKNDQIVIIIDKIEKMAIKIANQLKLDFNEDFFYRFARFEFLHELAHCTFDYDFEESNIFKHLTESYANWLALSLLPNDSISKQIGFIKIYHQPKEYGYGLFFGYNYNRKKFEKLIKYRINHNHKNAVKRFYTDIVGIDWYDIKPDGYIQFPKNVDRLYGFRDIYCAVGNRIKILGNVSGFIVANSVESITGILPPNSYLIANNIKNKMHYDDVKYTNCFEVSKDLLDIENYVLNNKISHEVLKDCYTRIFFADSNGTLNIDKIISIFNECLSHGMSLNQKNYEKKLKPITIHGKVFKKIKCKKCENIVEFPYKEGNIIHTVGCTFFAHIGDDTVTINEGHRITGCPSIEVFYDITIKCNCGYTLFTSKDFYKKNKD